MVSKQLLPAVDLAVAVVDILLEEEDKESSFDCFVRAVYGELQAGVTPEGLSGVFQGSMARLSSMARVNDPS